MFWLTLCCVVVQAGRDFYAILGVSKTASDADIKRAYRKLAVKFHPDKNPENKEEANKQFIEITNAYETLSDPDKRKLFDQYGEDGVNGGGQGAHGRGGHGGHGGGFADPFDVFQAFFQAGGGGGQHGFHFQFGGGGGGGGGGERRAEDMFGGGEGVKDIGAEEFEREVLKNGENGSSLPSVVVFYEEKDERLKKEMTKMASVFAHIVQVFGVNCTKHRQVCGQRGAKEQAKQIIVKYISETGKKEVKCKQPQSKTSRELGDWVNRQLADKSTVLTDAQSVKKWWASDGKAKVVLITDKVKTPPLWKALSREYERTVTFGVVLGSGDKTGFPEGPIPRLVFVKDAYLPEETEEFNGSMTWEVVGLFLTKAATAWHATSSKTLQPLTIERIKKTGDCSTKDSNFCFIWIGDLSKDLEKYKQLKSDIAARFGTDPIRFFWSPQSAKLLSLFGQVGNAHGILYRPKRGKFKLYSGEENGNLVEFIEAAISSGSLPLKVSGHLKDEL